MSSIKKYFEFVNNNLSEEELLEMANITDDSTGIDDVVLWIGPNPTTHGKRIKVSNFPKKISNTDLFTITIPDMNIIGEVNSNFITKSKLNDIKKFITINLSLIEDYSDYKISTKMFLDSIKPI